jgi:multiple sugar transport system ATP-binding protein
VLDTLAREGSDRVILGFRPESVEPVGDGDGFPLHVTVVEELGSDAFAYGTIEPPSEDPMAAVGKQVIAKVDPRKPPRKGERIQLKVRQGEELLFSTVTGERLAS